MNFNRGKQLVIIFLIVFLSFSSGNGAKAVITEGTITQTDNGTTKTGFNLTGSSYSNTSASPSGTSGQDASVQLSEIIEATSLIQTNDSGYVPTVFDQGGFNSEGSVFDETQMNSSGEMGDLASVILKYYDLTDNEWNNVMKRNIVDPSEIVFDGAGNYYVAHNHTAPYISKFSAEGELLVQFGDQGTDPYQFDYVNGMAVDSSENIYVSNNQSMIQKFDSYGNYLISWGVAGSGDGEFNNPRGVFVDSSDNVYVADSGNNRVQKFDSNGNYILQIGYFGSGNGELSAPYDIVVDSLGDIYVTDGGNNRVQKFSSTGTYIGQWGVSGTGDGEFNSPKGIDIDSSDNIYVTDGGNNRVQKFSSTGTYIGQWGVSGAGDGEFNSPTFISLDNSDNVYAIDFGNYRIQEFDNDGNFLISWGDNNIKKPQALAKDSSDNIYVTDYFSSQIKKFNSDGELLLAWGSYGTGNGEFNEAMGIAVDSAGNIYVADSLNHRIQKFNSSGTYVTQWGESGTGNGEFNYPRGIAVDSVGNIYVADSLNNRIQKFNSSGTYITQWGEAGSGDGQFGISSGIAIDSANNVYVTDLENYRVQKFDSDGNYITQWGGGWGSFDYPYYIAVDNINNIYVADYNNSYIQKFNSTGGYITQYGSSETVEERATRPTGVVVDSHFNIYFSEGSNNRVRKFSQGPFSGTYTSYLEAGDTIESWNTFSWTGFYPMGADSSLATLSFKIKTSNDNVSPPNFSSGTCDVVDADADGSLSLSEDCTSTDERYLWYQATLNSTDDMSDRPSLDSVVVNVTGANGFQTSGVYVSGVIDIGHDNLGWGNLEWVESGEQYVDIKLRSNSVADFSGATDWDSCGEVLNGESILSGSPNCVNNTDRYIQYQALLSNEYYLDTPYLESVSFHYSYDAVEYTLNYSTDSNGSISGSASQTVLEGEAGTEVLAVPNSGYHFVSWSDGVSNNPRTDENVSANISVVANFSQNESVDDEDEEEEYGVTDSECNPTKLEAKGVSSSEVKLAWKDNCEKEDGYEIERKMLDGKFEKIGKVDKNKKSYKDRNLEADTIYEYRVRAYDGKKESDYSNKDKARTLGDESPTVATVNDKKTDADITPQVQEEVALNNEDEDISGSNKVADNVLPEIQSRESEDEIKNQEQDVFWENPVVKKSSVVVEVIGLLTGASIAVAATTTPLFPLSPTPFTDGFSRFFSLFGILTKTKRRDDWGVVFDSQTRRPIEGAMVSIISTDGKIVESTSTNMEGKFGFLANKGEYRFEVSKNNYKLLDTETVDEFYGDLYDGKTFSIEDGEVAKMNIAMSVTNINWQDFIKRKIAAYTSVFSIVKRDIFIIIFYTGFIVSAGILYLAPSLFNWIVVILYSIILIYNLFFKVKNYGSITNEADKPVPFAIVSLYDENNLTERVAFAVSDIVGRYFILIKNGRYLMKVQGRELAGKTFNKTFKVDIKEGVLRNDIVL